MAGTEWKITAIIKPQILDFTQGRDSSRPFFYETTKTPSAPTRARILSLKATTHFAIFRSGNGAGEVNARA
jgi:hypothetical protein